MKEQVITLDNFELLLFWLGGDDRDHAAEQYEIIRARLIRLLQKRGCADAEDLADETIDRVMQKLPNIIENYTGEPIAYFYGVARRLLLEKPHRKALNGEIEKLPESSTGEIDEARRIKEARLECLDKCLEELPPDDREIIQTYYMETGQAKIDAHRATAERLGVTPGRLRLRAHRIRRVLRQCVKQCLAKKS